MVGAQVLVCVWSEGVHLRVVVFLLLTQAHHIFWPTARVFTVVPYGYALCTILLNLVPFTNPLCQNKLTAGQDAE